MKAKVLFVCVENSCRSQMAEGFAKKHGGEVLDAWSAGSKPSGKVNPKAVRLMREAGVDLSAHASKGLEDLPSAEWDYVITMGCGDACPHFPAKARLDWSLPDPKVLRDDLFRKVRDKIERKVKALVKDVSAPARRR